MNTGEMAAVVVDAAAKMTWRHYVEGALSAAVSGGFATLGASLLDTSGGFSLFNRAGLTHAATLFVGGAFVGVGIYLKGLFTKTPEKPFDPTTDKDRRGT